MDGSEIVTRRPDGSFAVAEAAEAARSPTSLALLCLVIPRLRSIYLPPAEYLFLQRGEHRSDPLASDV